MLGGVRIDDAPRLAGHSDGDAVAHAVADAILGPAGLPDLGTLFPDTDEQYRGADSMELLAEVARLAAHQGWWVENVDVVVAAETPALGPHVDAMAANLVAHWRRRGSRWARASAWQFDPSEAKASARSDARRASRSGRSPCLLSAARTRPAPRRATSPISLVGCCGSTTPRDGRRSTSSRPSKERCRCTSAAHSRTTCSAPGHGRKEVVFDTIRRYLLWSGRGDVREQRHRHRGQDHLPGPRKRGRPSPRGRQPFRRDVPERVRPPEHPAPRSRATRHRVDRRDDRPDRATRLERSRVRRRRPRGLLPGRHACRLRRAFASHARGAARERGRARRRRRAQARTGRLPRCGRRPSPASPPGISLGGSGVRVGTSNARRCR